MKTLFAFWRYDAFPYVLGAEILEMGDDGFVSARGFTGMRFKPIKILPLKAGVFLKQKLDELRTAERAAHQEVDTKFRKELEKLFPEAIRR